MARIISNDKQQSYLVLSKWMGHAVSQEHKMHDSLDRQQHSTFVLSRFSSSSEVSVSSVINDRDCSIIYVVELGTCVLQILAILAGLRLNLGKDGKDSGWNATARMAALWESRSRVSTRHQHLQVEQSSLLDVLWSFACDVKVHQCVMMHVHMIPFVQSEQLTATT